MCLCVRVLCQCMPHVKGWLWRPEDESDTPELDLQVGNCDLPNVGAENQAWASGRANALK